ncbi:FAD-dependent oxidoreductase [Thermosulfurimonas sp. F29]|uniref:FAD-dependent oxidoreductase n=1 Tax=Thermosulfurimonas sp. F29 TaxID=2867247 RepID=UPI001C833805|nr:FAD-dependent oxidoreductase [Thermosulfurimonas sp. F29]MBX6422303.1 FAD-dependent oxidoreductase [Thermosulfurimonas sp. F29]
MPERYPVVIIGGGISGMETALTLAEMGYRSLLVEREGSIGGKMILLSKVFPTLDCASCIATPKMAAVRNEERIELLVAAEVREIVREARGFRVKIWKRPTYVDPSRCTGCGRCEEVCPVVRPDQFNAELTVRRAIYIPFPQAVPRKALVEKKGLSPCSGACPLGIRVHALVALLRAGRFREALWMHLREAPLPGALSLLCEAPCEASCTLRKRTGRPMPVRAIRKVLLEKVNPEEIPFPGPRRKERVAVLGGGPRALSCAYALALEGYRVVLWAGEEELGGFLRDHPLLDPEVLERDLALVRPLLEIRRPEGMVRPEDLIGQGFSAVFLEKGTGLEVNERTFETPLPGVFASLRPSASLLREVFEGKEAARKIMSHLSKKHFEPRTFSVKGRAPGEIPALDLGRVQEEASRCLDCGACCECRSCVEACPAGAIDFTQKGEHREVETGAVVIATGFRLYEPEKDDLYGYRRDANVITGMQLERLLAPTRPYNALLRPSDGRIPGNIGLILCVGSRSLREGTPRCSRICCMYSLKQAQLLLGAVPFAEVSIYYMDIRSFGKGYERFRRQTEEMGVHLIRGRVAYVEEAEEGDLWVYYEDFDAGGKVRRNRHDLVVLATGALADPSLRRLLPGEALDEVGFVREEGAPGTTREPGIFVVGGASEPRDIPDTVVHAQAVALKVALHLRRTGFEA